MRGAKFIIATAVLAAVGCNKSDSPTAAEASAKAAPADASQKVHPAAQAATSFLKATASGEMKAAQGMLTPLAAEQLNKSGQCLMPLNVESPRFQVTRLLVPQADEAAVEFRMQFEKEGQPQQFDGCCFMKNVAGSWRLAGVALDPGDGSAPIVQNYEADVPAGPAAQNPAATVSTPQSASQIPHTAQGPSSSHPR